MSDTTTAPVAPETPVTTPSKPARSKPAAKPAAKANKNGTAKPAAKKAGRKPTGNLPFDEARVAVLKALNKGPRTRNQLKEVAPYGNYTGLCQALEEAGEIKHAPGEGERLAQYEITAKGRKALAK